MSMSFPPTLGLVLNGSVLQGVRAPYALVLDLVPSDKLPDLSVVTAADLEVHRGNGTTETWDCTMSSQTATTLTLTHTWASGENDTPGEQMRIYARLTTPDGVIVVRPILVNVQRRS